ncbi:glycine cleavage system aminomethyltransferase GcvT [Chryseobacterium sp. A301]
MKRTPLFDTHVSLGAKMVPFAGFEMPVQYSGLTQEHFAVRESVGLFDVSHMGQFFVEGKEAKDLLQKVTTNNLELIENGKAQYTCLPNAEGGIIDDLIVYKMNDEKYFVVVNASNIEKDFEHIQSHNQFEATLTNASDQMALIAIQGPKAKETLQKVTGVDLSTLPYYSFTQGEVAGVKDVIISNTGYTGSGGYELYFQNKDAVALWTALSEAGSEFGILPCGLGARDTLRLEKGFCLYGNDIDDTTSPLEAGLGWITKLDKGDFVAKDKIAALKANGITRKLVGFEMQEKAIPRHDYPVVDKDGNTIGKVTSGTMSPMKKVGIGLAYVEIAHSKIDSEIFIQIRNKSVSAKVVKTPFV